MNSKVEILLAEDEEYIAKLVEFKLSREGFQVVVARNGQEAIDRLESRNWSLIILDVMMPIFDGWKVLQMLRASSKASIPVLMLTAKSNQKDVSNAADLGATELLSKPFDPTELASRVRKMVGSFK